MFAIIDWDGVWRPRREYTAQLAARGWSCLYTTGLVTTWDLRRGAWKGLPWFRRLERRDGVIVDRAGRFPFDWPGRAIGTLARRWQSQRIRAALDVDDRNMIAIVTDPSFWPQIEALRPRYVVYYVYDSFSEMAGWSAYAAALQDKLIARADLVLCVTESMADALPNVRRERVRIMPNAVRLDSFERGRSAPCPDILAAIPHPRIGFIGGISPAIDYDAVLYVARNRPDWNLVFIGWIDEGASDIGQRDHTFRDKWSALTSLPNVHYFPPIPTQSVPAHLSNMDVLAVWYRNTDDGFWRHSQPIKLYEGLATGKPIVGPDLPGFRAYDSVVAVADGHQGWLSAVAQAVEKGGVGTPEARIAIARENSWEKRAGMLESWLVEMIRS